ncbi:unnamed protein product [Rotaria sp. Silwood2]|nr:unnamed protein product [Rotaria sp. Silwood2]
MMTYILAKKSRLRRFITDPLGMSDPALTLFTAIGDNTIGWNYEILVVQILLFLLILIIIDSGLLQLSLSCLYKSNFDENKLDDVVLAEQHTDHLTVNNLVQYYPMRKVLAVNYLTFGARSGEAFGLLG